MNPPGGLSIIIHILIVLLGAARRAFLRLLRRSGLTDTAVFRFLARAVRPLQHVVVQRTLAYSIITALSLALLATVSMSLESTLTEDTNIDFLIRLVQQQNRLHAAHTVAQPFTLTQTAYANMTPPCAALPCTPTSFTPSSILRNTFRTQ